MARPWVTAATKIMRIEIVLVESEPVVRRMVEVPDGASLAVLHEVMQEAMGWDHAHLHEFQIAGTPYGVPDPDFDPEFDTRTVDESTTRLSELLSAGDVVEYLYDFGDSWRHRLTVEAVTTPEPGVRYPRCVAGQGACPPEDVGGVWGYQRFLEVLADPADPEHSEHVEWWGSDRFDPTLFDLDETNDALKRLAWTALQRSSTARR
ncbi:plasmid pRiA4b ORF-3 family protein [Pseudonocardia humida]|uniref:Plasmid pRiA4b ORF-3 family protein n=1 Tax=Pseudonocardia humida TaxID=2800819 RepID=A0ABT1AE94_9PSEU|nr:plasmid pRiA4b ORF-3 family protein [Pseudonocardia humida]MCO1660994.1 plasmid pRiA4b ORF-3 family protein [Pseudonocardia humida]